MPRNLSLPYPYEKGSEEEEFFKHSPLISLTRNVEIAMEFADRDGDPPFDPTKFSETASVYDATHFIWRFEAPLTSPLCDGVWLVSYQSKGAKIVEHIAGVCADAQKKGDPEKLADLVRIVLALAHLDNDTKEHRCLAIDAVTFLEHNVGDVPRDLWARALERAERDEEWLLGGSTRTTATTFRSDEKGTEWSKRTGFQLRDARGR